MLILAATTDTIEVVLGGASVSPLPIFATYRDITTSAYTPGRSAINTSGTTPVVGVDAPAASTQRVIDFINIYNPNVANATVTVRIDLNGTEYILTSVTLAQGERLVYQEGAGWQCYTIAGAIKNSLNQGTNTVASGDSLAVLGADVTNNNATANTIADVTGLSFPVVSGTRYWFEFWIRYTAAATGTGSRWSINGPSFTDLAYDSEYALTTTTKTFNVAQIAYNLPAASNATSPQSTGGNLAWITGFILPSANGDVVARFASEVASSAITAKAGSFVRYRAL
jgi:hypothetical protein